MFSFHRPKTYRSVTGCCICKAKSSSSRFTDSTRYEDHFEHCFDITDYRHGEICNACVLLVKRYKKLEPCKRVERNWNHMVDARSGPGTKSITKIKKRAKKKNSKNGTPNYREENKLRGYKHKWVPKKRRRNIPEPEPSTSRTTSDDQDMTDNSSDHSDDERSSTSSPCEESSLRRINRRMKRFTRRPMKSLSSKCVLIDPAQWKRMTACCGLVYLSRCGQDVIIDQSTFKPCAARRQKPQQRVQCKRLDSECSAESGVVFEEDLKFPTPPVTQPSSPVSEEKTMTMIGGTVPKHMVMDLSSAHPVDDDTLFDDDDEMEPMGCIA